MSDYRNYIDIDEMQERGVYEIRSRNLKVGVWSPKSQGFIGVREKFGERYLFTEYHYDTGAPHGTASPMQLITMLPDGIEVKEREDDPDELCNCGRATYWKPDSPLKEYPGVRHHKDDNSPLWGEGAEEGHIKYAAPQNKLLFDFLEGLDDKA